MKKLSVIISNRNDLAMLSVTFRSCLEAFKALGERSGEVIICDNSDEPTYNLLKGVLPTKYLKEGTLKIVRQDFPCLFTARETAAKHASAPYILCLDSHMLVGHNTFLDLYNFMESKSSDPTLGFAHAPINWAHQHESSSRHDRDLKKDELGPWNNRYNDIRTITWKGMPWICRREWFLSKTNGIWGYGSLAKHKISWGGGDMHIGTKPWLLGYRNWAVPTNPCIHIGPFPKGDKKAKISDPHMTYRLYSGSGNHPFTFGFLLSCYVLGGEEMMERNLPTLTERFGKYINFKKHWKKAIELGTEEREWLLANQKISYDQMLKTEPWKPV